MSLLVMFCHLGLRSIAAAGASAIADGCLEVSKWNSQGSAWGPSGVRQGSARGPASAGPPPSTIRVKGLEGMLKEAGQVEWSGGARCFDEDGQDYVSGHALHRPAHRMSYVVNANVGHMREQILEILHRLLQVG